MQIFNNPTKAEWQKLLTRGVNETKDLEDKVQAILDEIRADGDVAVKKYTKLFDGVAVDEMLVSDAEFEAASEKVTDELKQAIDIARENIERFHAAQKHKIEVIETAPGVKCWQKSVAIQKVGLYVPGGSAPLFSTVLMLGIPAVIAGCSEIVLCTPPDKEGNIHPAILYAANLIGITKVYKVGGVQAIGAMAYGTETIAQVYKIFGPGNQFVTMAKQLVAKKDVAIDMPAGPSEVLVYADETCEPSFVAADLLSQAEHGPDSQVILVTGLKKVADEINNCLYDQLAQLPRKAIAEKALENSRAFVISDIHEAIDLMNEYATEHLILATDHFEEIAASIENAGSVFLGNYTMESAGDYASGTNHTLPTNGHAKAFSGVNLDSFIKKITFQQITPEGLNNIGKAIEVMAEEEQLFAHKNAVTLRLQSISNE